LNYENFGEYVQYGCGLSAPAGWRNFDASPTLQLQRIPIIGRIVTSRTPHFPHNVEYGDVTRGLPLRNESCVAVYCSHVLEHLALDDFRKALTETNRLLSIGGVFRLVVPDLERCIQHYVKSDSHDAAVEFMKETMLGKASRSRGFAQFLREWLGNSHHLWMWDYKSLRHELVAAGFMNIRRAQYGDSPDPAFLEVEEETRWAGCLGIECNK